MDLNKNNIKKILLIITYGLILFTILQNLSFIGGLFSKAIDLIYPFILGAAMAFIINIPMNMYEKIFKKMKVGKRFISLILAIFTLILIIGLVIGIVIPEIVDVTYRLLSGVPDAFENAKEIVLEFTENYPFVNEQIENLKFDFDNLDKDFLSSIKNVIGTTTNIIGTTITSSVSIISSFFSGILNFVIALIFAIYILLQKEKLGAQFRKLFAAYLPKEKNERVLEIIHTANTIFNSFITGQVKEAMILGILCAIGMMIFGFPYAVTVGVLTAFTALIPVVGGLVGGAIGALLILSESLTKAIWFIIFMVILQQLESNLIYPRVVGDSVGLPGIWVLVAITVGAGVFGIIGMLISVPILAVVYVFLRKDVNKKLGLDRKTQSKVKKVKV